MKKSRIIDLWFCRVVVFVNSNDSLVGFVERHFKITEQSFLFFVVAVLIILISIGFTVAVEKTFRGERVF